MPWRANIKARPRRAANLRWLIDELTGPCQPRRRPIEPLQRMPGPLCWGPGSRSFSAIWRYALAARPVIWLIGIVGGPIRAPPIVTPLDVSGASTRSGRRRLVNCSTDDRTGDEGRRRKPETIILPVAGTTIPVASVTTPVGAVSTAFEPVSAPIPAVVATVVTVSPILHIRHIGRYGRRIGHENRRSGSGYRRTNCK